MKKRVFMVLLALSVVVGFAAASNAETGPLDEWNNRVYENKDAGITLELPGDWIPIPVKTLRENTLMMAMNLVSGNYAALYVYGMDEYESADALMDRLAAGYKKPENGDAPGGAEPIAIGGNVWEFAWGARPDNVSFFLVRDAGDCLYSMIFTARDDAGPDDFLSMLR